MFQQLQKQLQLMLQQHLLKVLQHQLKLHQLKVNLLTSNLETSLKRIFWILAFVLAVIGKVYAQEEGDDFFDEDEPPAESDFEYQPPQAPVKGLDDSTIKRENRFTRPPNVQFPPTNQSVGMNSDGSFEFKLVDPPQYKTKKPKLNVPPAVRAKVENNLKAIERNEKE
jgi:hypothetical protein